MQKAFACVAMLVAGSLVGCSKDTYKEPSTAAYETVPRGRSVPTKEAKRQVVETPVMTPASGTTVMTPASGATPPPVGTQPGPELAVGSRGAVILQDEAADELGHAICERQARCESAARECDQTVKERATRAVEGCDHGLSRTEFYVCLTAISEKACGTSPSELTECNSSSLCLP
ncbi:MAG TPA: hypothetical protein VM686_31550 [Polyangiaceae bacterium]|nr:hypothetical protein [Polyangiaceae bacterium]